MSYYEDSLFGFSINVSIEGDADSSPFDAEAENSFSMWLLCLGAKLLDSSLDCYKCSPPRSPSGKVDAWAGLALESFLIPAVMKLQVKDSFGDTADRMNDFDVLEAILSGDITIPGTALRVAFADMVNAGEWRIAYSDFILTNQHLRICLELETKTTVYQYYWRSRWALTLMCLPVNSPKTLKKLFRQGAEIIRPLGKLLSSKLLLRRSRSR